MQVPAVRRFWIDGRGSVAVEFAFIGPLFVLLMMGIVCFGGLFGIYFSVQELTSEAARAAVSGVTDSERQSIVRSFITGNVRSYPLLDPKRVTIESRTTDSTTRSYTVTVTYDASTSYVYSFSGLIPLPDPVLRRSAVIRQGGY
jgi:Flp pilus assembly protein TadG